MAIFVTGSTGYLGSYVVAGLLTDHRDKLNLLVRAKTEREARERLWTSLQLHFEFPEFLEHLNMRVCIFRGDLTDERFGLPDDDYHELVDTTDSLIHCADPLRRFAEPQIGKAMLECKLAGHARGDSIGAAGAGPSWVAAVFARFHGGGRGKKKKRSRQ